MAESMTTFWLLTDSSVETVLFVEFNEKEWISILPWQGKELTCIP